jgi:hypothetical protein
MASRKRRWRVVVVAVDPPPIWNLPAATELTWAEWVSGGQQELYELAVAAAAGGHDVELRGDISTPLLDAIAEAAGARPETPTEQRRPEADDLVIISEGGNDPLRFARLALSPARVVLAILAPTGLFGWPFVTQRYAEDPLTMPLNLLARPEHFRAIAALDMDIWTPESRTHELASAAGARSEMIGHGSPVPLDDLVETKDIDVAYLEGSRWRALAEQAAATMTRPVHAIAIGSRESVLDSLARTKVLLWPARIEGRGTILWEARSVGAVVVALASNRHAVGLDESHGAIAVDTIEEMPAVAEQLLGDPARLAALAEAGRRTAAEQVDWDRYVARVSDAIERVQLREAGPTADARAAFGARVDDVFVRPQDELRAELSETQKALDETRRQLVEVAAALTAARAGAARGQRLRELARRTRPRGGAGR